MTLRNLILVAMASNLIAMASNLEAMASNLIAMASNLVAMASNLRAMASKHEDRCNMHHVSKMCWYVRMCEYRMCSRAHAKRLHFSLCYNLMFKMRLSNCRSPEVLVISLAHPRPYTQDWRIALGYTSAIWG